MAKAKAKPVRKAATPKTRLPPKAKAAKPRPPRKGTKAWVAKAPKRGKGFRYEACPICGSRDLEVRKKDGLAKGAGKVLAGSLYAPLVLEFHDRYACRACG